MAERDLLVRILGDDRDLQRALKSTERSVQQIDKRTATFGKNVTRAFGAAGIALGTATIFEGLDASIEAASNLNEQIARSEQIFESNAESVKDWSETLAESFGIAQAKGLEFAGTFGLLFRNLGVSTDQAETFSRQLVELAADLASFNNTSVDDALGALRSGLTGESVLVRLNIIMEDTVRAQGDFARTSDGLANQQRKLQAQLQNLSAAFGAVLVPKVLETVEAVNDLIGAFKRLQDAIPSGGKGATQGFFDELFSSLPAQIADQARNLQQMGRDIDFVLRHGPFQARGLGFEEIGEVVQHDIEGLAKHIEASLPVVARVASAIQGAIDELDAALKAGATKLTKAQGRADRLADKRAGKVFDEFVQGMSLKLDKARLTEEVDNDIAALNELEAAIVRRIEREGKTFKLVQQLTQTRLEINSLVAQRASAAEAAGVDAFDATVDALNLELEIAQANKSFKAEEAALRAIEQAILDRIAAEGQTTDLLRQLFNVRQEQIEVARRLAEQRRERRQERQFGALGLTEEGERPTPGVGALRRRLSNLRDQIKGTTLDTEKTRRELDRIAQVLSGKFGAVGKEVRDAILQMFNDIAGALDEGGKKGPLTKTSGLNTKKILDGLGLSDAQINELRSRLSSINTAGRQLESVPSTTAPSGARLPSRGFGPIFVESTTTINLDGQQVAKVVTKQQQKAKRRNPQQKRGPNRR